MNIQIGDKMHCDLLNAGQRTGKRIPVTILQVTRHWQTNEPISARVRTHGPGKDRFVWVQMQMLHTEDK